MALSVWILGTFVLGGIISLWSESSDVSRRKIFHLSPLYPCITEDMLDKTSSVEDDGHLTSPLQLLTNIPRNENSTETLAGPLRAPGHKELLKTFFKHYLPAVIVVRRSLETNRSPVLDIFKQVIRVLMLLALTFLFAGLVGGRAFQVALFVTTILVTVTSSRALSLYISCRLEEATQLAIIECETTEEMEWMTRLVCSIPGSLVVSQTGGDPYSKGFRIKGPTIGYLARESSRFANRISVTLSLIMAGITWFALFGLNKFGLTAGWNYPKFPSGDVEDYSGVVFIIFLSLTGVSINLTLFREIFAYTKWNQVSAWKAGEAEEPEVVEV